MTDLTASTRDWAIRLTEQPSVTGTADEASFGPWLAQELQQAFGAFPDCTIWTEPVAAGDPRHVVYLLLCGDGPDTVVLTGHYDTVTTADYGPLADLAIRPADLTPALLANIAGQDGPAAARARADLQSGDYLPGRGLLDMKAGLAAALAVIEDFATTNATGNLLFIAVPDEESGSAGARAAAPALAGIATQHGLHVTAVLNLDAIADDGDGSAGRAIALGTVGKVLPTAFVVGLPVHSGYPLRGLNAAVLIAAIAARVEWAIELTDGSAGTPPSLLLMRDGKTGYDVTTPGTAFAAWNVLFTQRTPEAVAKVFATLCQEAVQACVTSLTERARQRIDLPPVRVISYADVLTAARGRHPAIDTDCATIATTNSGLSLPEQCRLITAHVWTQSGLAGPAVVTGFGSIPYLSTDLSSSKVAIRLRSVLRDIAAQSQGRFGEAVRIDTHFAGISDMSFFGEADEAPLQTVAANTPVWNHAFQWPDVGALAQMPTVNIGPWGRDYHTPLERIHVGYGFDTLPRLLRDVVTALLTDSRRP